MSEGFRWPAVRLPCYSGEEPAETYLNNVQLAAHLNAWTAGEMAVQVALSLEGKALQILTDLQPDERFNWPAIKRAIQHHLANVSTLILSGTNSPTAKEERVRDGCVVSTHSVRTPHLTQEELVLQALIQGLRP